MGGEKGRDLQYATCIIRSFTLSAWGPVWIHHYVLLSDSRSAPFIVKRVQFLSLSSTKMQHSQFKMETRSIWFSIYWSALQYACSGKLNGSLLFGCCSSKQSYYKLSIKFSCSQPLFQRNTAWHQFVGITVKHDPLSLLPEQKFRGISAMKTDGKCLLLRANSSHKPVISLIYVLL